MSTSVYGIIGFPLGHSFSKKYFENKFEELGLNDSARFDNFAIESIEQLPSVVNTPGLKGFCITIPHKKHIIPLLQHQSPEVEAIGACNCVRYKNGELTGYNTDIIGFEKSFIPQLNYRRNKALILGTGGAAVAVAYVLDKLKISYKYVSRSAQNRYRYEDITPEIMDEYKILINCTPLGMYPKVEAAPPLPYEHLTADHYLYDLIYNPEETKFLRYGKEKGSATENGLQMLILQAEENWRIWNS